MSPLSSLQALRSSIALMAPPPALAASVAAAWTAQQQQIQGILARLEAQFRWAGPCSPQWFAACKL